LQTGKEATVSGVLKLLAGEASRERRELSRAGAAIPEDLDLRIGDCRHSPFRLRTIGNHGRYCPFDIDRRRSNLKAK
jgi:hypothetical protein